MHQCAGPQWALRMDYLVRWLRLVLAWRCPRWTNRKHSPLERALPLACRLALLMNPHGYLPYTGDYSRRKALRVSESHGEREQSVCVRERERERSC
jgi:hypothetical protein